MSRCLPEGSPEIILGSTHAHTVAYTIGDGFSFTVGSGAEQIGVLDKIK